MHVLFVLNTAASVPYTVKLNCMLCLMLCVELFPLLTCNSRCMRADPQNALCAPGGIFDFEVQRLRDSMRRSCAVWLSAMLLGLAVCGVAAAEQSNSVIKIFDCHQLRESLEGCAPHTQLSLELHNSVSCGKTVHIVRGTSVTMTAAASHHKLYAKPGLREAMLLYEGHLELHGLHLVSSSTSSSESISSAEPSARAIENRGTLVAKGCSFTGFKSSDGGAILSGSAAVELPNLRMVNKPAAIVSVEAVSPPSLLLERVQFTNNTGKACVHYN
jgi:hypothetical protein